MTDQKTDLLPCPFCGGEAEFVGSLPKSGYDRVVCIKCYAEYSGDDEALSITGWNTRADLAPKVKPLEWEKMDESAWIAHGIEQAEYHISTSDGSVWEFSLHYDPEEDPDFTGSEGEVKAYVEQVHKHRILSALIMKGSDE